MVTVLAFKFIVLFHRQACTPKQLFLFILDASKLCRKNHPSYKKNKNILGILSVSSCIFQVSTGLLSSFLLQRWVIEES